MAGSAAAAGPAADTVEAMLACRTSYAQAKAFAETMPHIAAEELASDEASGWTYGYDPRGLTAFGLPVTAFTVSDYLSGGEQLIDIEATVPVGSPAAQKGIEQATGRTCAADGALMGMIVLREKVGRWRLVGCGVLIAGVILLSSA